MNSSNVKKEIEITDVLNVIDIIIRVTFLSTHISYFIMIFLFKEFQKLSYLNMHHSILIGLFLSILYCSWIAETESLISDSILRNLFCTISEVCWALFRMARAYSILALAVYRYLAVYSGPTFKKISKSKIYIFLTVFLVWIFPIFIFVIFKFSFQTYPGLLCLDGFTTDLKNSIIYYVFTTILGVLIPIILVVIAYALVHIRLKNIASALSRCSSETLANKKAKKERKLAKQFCILNFIEILSTFFWILISISSWIPRFNDDFYYLRQIWRILNNLSQALIPIVSLIFHPTKIKLQNIRVFKIKGNTSADTKPRYKKNS